MQARMTSIRIHQLINLCFLPITEKDRVVFPSPVFFTSKIPNPRTDHIDTQDSFEFVCEEILTFLLVDQAPRNLELLENVHVILKLRYRVHGCVYIYIYYK